jgi:dipeptidyl aminopeptidase/acylaminoacyl peptidase
MIALKSGNRNNIRMVPILVVLCLAAGGFPKIAFSQASAAGSRRQIFDKFLDFNQLIKNANLRPIWSDTEDSFRYAENGVIYKVDPRKNSKEIDKSAPPARAPFNPNKILSPDGKFFLERRNNNLFLGAAGSVKPEALTSDGIPDNSWGAAPSAWSPDGTKIILQRSDVRKVHRIPLVDFTQAIETVEWARYAKAGDALARTELYLYDVPSQAVRKIDLGEHDQYIFGLDWLPDGSQYLFLRVSRNGKTLELQAYRPVTGEIKTLIKEIQKTFVAGLDFLTGGWSKQLTVLKDTRRLLWLSERDGWRQIYLYDFDGRLLRQLTKGEFCIDEVSAVDPKNKRVYFIAYGGTGINDRHLYQVNMDGRSQKRLTDIPGYHLITFSPSGAFYIDTHSGIDRPPVSELHRADGRLLQVVSAADISAIQELHRTPPEAFVVKAGDGKTDIYGVIYKPYDFDSTRKYPVIDFIYQGLFITSAPSSYVLYSGSALFAQAMAQMGFVTFVVDGRALPNRSKEFQDASFGNIGRIEIPDQVAALKQIAAQRPYMDLSRVGIYGHSWGGYFSLRGILTAPDVFSVGVASAPGELTEAPEINEPYMDLPQNNKEGYAAGLNAAQAANLKGKLLLIHGTHDTNAPISTTFRMVDALVKAGKLHDLAIIPKMDHSTRAPAFRKYYWDLVTNYFIEHLKPY